MNNDKKEKMKEIIKKGGVIKYIHTRGVKVGRV